MVVLVFLAAFFASLVVDADVVVPVRVHAAVVAVAERSGAKSLLAGARRLQYARAALEGRWTIVVLRVGAGGVGRVVTVLLVLTLLAPGLGFNDSLWGHRRRLREHLVHRIFDVGLDAKGVGCRDEQECGELGLHRVFGR